MAHALASASAKLYASLRVGLQVLGWLAAER